MHPFQMQSRPFIPAALTCAFAKPLALILATVVLTSVPMTGSAAAPVLHSNQVLWVPVPATNGAAVGIIGLADTNNVDKALTFRIISAVPFNPFAIELSTNDYFGLLSIANSNLLATTNLFSIQVAVNASTNQALGSTNWVKVIAPLPLRLGELSTNGTSAGRIVSAPLTESLLFRIDTNAIQDPLSVQALRVEPDGEVRVADSTALDFETQSNYVLRVVATNKLNTLPPYNEVGGPVLVLLTNVNEAPLFTDQAFTLPTNSIDTLIGILRAQDPESDPLEFQILKLEAGGGVVPNDYFEVRSGNQLHLRSGAPSAPSSNLLTVVVREIRTDGQPVLTNVASVTIEASKTYSRFGIPLLIPLAGHEVIDSPGLPVQAVASGTNQELYVAGMDANRLPYLQIYAGGPYRDPTLVALETNFIPSVVAADGTNVYVGGTRMDLLRAVVYRYSVKGVLLTNNFLDSWYTITDLMVQQGRLFLCGGAGGSPSEMVPYWAELDGSSLVHTNGSPHSMGSVSSSMPLLWLPRSGVATAITRESSSGKIFVAGYWKATWLWYYYPNWIYRILGIPVWTTSPGHFTFIASGTNPALRLTETVTSQNAAERSGKIITALKLVDRGGNVPLYVLEENAVNGIRNIQVKEYDSGLALVSGHNLSISGTADIRATSLAWAGEAGSEALYVTGVLPGSRQTTFTSGGISVNRYPSGDRFFLAKLEPDLKFSSGWSDPLLLSAYNYTPAGGSPPPTITELPSYTPKRPLSIVVPYESRDGVLLAGNIQSGTLTISQDRNQNSVTAPPGRNAGFVTIVKTNKLFEVPNFLEVVSEFGVSGIHVRPFSGKQMAVIGDTYTAEVLSPIYVRADGTYIGSLDNRATDEQIRDEAVTRYVCTGYTVEDTEIIGDGSSYTFEFRKNTKITFHWTVEHALEIRSDLGGTGALPMQGGYVRDTAHNLGLTSLAAGNPVPEVKKHWIKKDELVIPGIDGVAYDMSEAGTRYVVTGYAAEGWAVSSSAIPKPSSQTNLFPAVEPRLQIPQFPMRGPARVTYFWGIQHRIQVSTTTLESQDWPGIKVIDDPAQPSRAGSGEFWFNRNTHVIVGARDVGNSLRGAMLQTGDLTGVNLDKTALSAIPGNHFELVIQGFTNNYIGAHVDSLSRGTIVSWEYGDQLFLQTVSIGNSVNLPLAVPVPNLSKINTNKAPVIVIQDSPPGSTTDDMCDWDGVARLSYPLRPGRFLLHYEGRDTTNIAATLSITSELPATAHYRHLAHPEQPAVNLDPSRTDTMAFLKLAFSTNATVVENHFVATNRDMSVLVFSRSATNTVATGNRTTERLMVRVVSTTPWDELPQGFDPEAAPTKTYIGTKVASALDTAGIGTGFIVYTNARYNASIYDRTKTADAGPIIPVNRVFRTEDPTHDLVIIWSERRDGLLWPYTAERFDPQWPVVLDAAVLPDPLPDVETMMSNGTNYLRRIVVASRLGSEGKDAALRNQLSFAQPRYDQVTLYHQPNPARPGYNPNEEHALIAPSFKFLDQGSPPPVVYALRNDFNRLDQDTNYTSDPMVLVQYLDHGTNGGPGEYKMAVYAIELEDDRPQLNPDRYVSAISGQEREFPYVFHYGMKAAEPVQPPYPLGLVIGLTPCSNTRGENITNQRVYWEDHLGQPWAVSAGDFRSYFYYALPEEFWVPNQNVSPPGSCLAFPTAQKVVLTGANPNPRFSPNSRFTLNGEIVTVIGNNAESFVLAISANAVLNSQVDAVVLDTGEIQLRARGTNTLALGDSTYSPLSKAGLAPGLHQVTPAVQYTASWPESVPVLKAGETLTFAGGEFKADYPGADGLPGVIGWAAGEVIFDSLNPRMDTTEAFAHYTSRLISPLEERTVQLTASDAAALVELIQPATGLTQARGTRWSFTKLPASLSRRVFYDPLDRRLGIKGFINDKMLGDSTLTAAPPPVYVLEPNILTAAERDTLSSLVELQSWRNAVANLYALSRNPNNVRRSPTDTDPSVFYVGLEHAVLQANNQDVLDANANPVLLPYEARPQKALGPGLALVPSPAVLDPESGFTEGYVTLVENNDPDAGGAITLFIVKVSKEFRYRGAIKTILSDNVFDERVTLRHSGDFGANTEDIIYQWFYREEDGTEAPLPPGGAWKMFPDQSDNSIRGLGMHQINLEGTGGLLLADNLFFVRYRHRNDDESLSSPNSTDWTGTEWDRYGRFVTEGGQITKVGSQWAGAANSPSVDGEYQPQLVMGWIKRVLDRVNPYEARISDFRSESAPATYASMIQELGQRYEGPVALNADKNVIENVGLIELYETVFNRAMDLSINLSSPITTPGINTALQLAATRLSDFYMVLGNEAYADAQAPTIAYGDDSMDFATDYGAFASSMFCFQNEVGSLVEEELSLLRGVPEFYGRPVYNRLFWNFTKSLGEVAYTVNYNITDYNRDGFVNESDAMSLFPQGHGDAWGHYLTAVKSHYRLLQHPYYNWISRAEQYNLLDVVIDVDYLDERRFAEAAAARAKTGAEIVNLTYRSRYVEDPDGQWQGYTDTDTDRAWGVDGWARRAGQGALFDWITANALIPSEDTNTAHNALQKIDRSTVTAIQTLSSELGEIQSQYDSANNGLNPLGLAPDVVPFDIDVTFNAIGSTAQVGRYAVQGQGHFSQIYERAVAAVANARTVFETANFMQSRQRQVVESADSFRQEVIEQDLDYRNRLIEIFGTPYEGQIGTGKAYPSGYYGPDLMLWMYVDVNDVNSATVPPSFTNITAWVGTFEQQITTANSGTGVTDFQTLRSKYFAGDLSGITNVDQLDFQQANVLALTNLPISANGYTFQAPAGWGRRASPGELQISICEMVQAEADVELAIGEYFLQVQRIQDLADLLAAKHKVSAESIKILRDNRTIQITLSGIMSGVRALAATFEILGIATDKTGDAIEASIPGANPPVIGMANSIGDFPKAAVSGVVKAAKNTAANVFNSLKVAAECARDILEDRKEMYQQDAEINVQVQGFTYEIQEQLKELEQTLRTERLLRIEVFKRLEALRQVSDRYRQTLEGGRRLLDQRQVFNIRAAGVTQRLRYQDMAFRVFRNDALQKYRAAYDLAARYTYMAAKAFDYETNLDPSDRGSAQPLLTEIVQTRLLGAMQDGEPVIGTGLAGVLAIMRDNWSVLCGRMSFNNAQYEQQLISLRSELFRIPPGTTNDALWRQTLKNYRVEDLWRVPEFRRYCRPPAARSAGAIPGLVIPFGTEIVFGRNFFGWPLGPGDHAYDPSVFATKVLSAAVYFTNYQTTSLSATPRVYLVPAGLDFMTIPTSANLETRSWTIVDQAIPVPFKTSTNDLADPYWIAGYDSLSEPFGQIRRFSSFLAKDITNFDPGGDSLSYDTRLIGRSIWNTRWLLIIPGGHLLSDGGEGLDRLIDGTPIPGDLQHRDLNGIKDIQLLFNTYGYSGN